jgi:hypothetical protein
MLLLKMKYMIISTRLGTKKFYYELALKHPLSKGNGNSKEKKQTKILFSDL